MRGERGRKGRGRERERGKGERERGRGERGDGGSSPHLTMWGLETQLTLSLYLC